MATSICGGFNSWQVVFVGGVCGNVPFFGGGQGVDGSINII